MYTGITVGPHVRQSSGAYTRVLAQLRAGFLVKCLAEVVDECRREREENPWLDESGDELQAWLSVSGHRPLADRGRTLLRPHAEGPSPPA